MLVQLSVQIEAYYNDIPTTPAEIQGFDEQFIFSVVNETLLFGNQISTTVDSEVDVETPMEVDIKTPEEELENHVSTSIYQNQNNNSNNNQF